MSRRAVAQNVPFLGYRQPNGIETPKSRSGEPLFRGVVAKRATRRLGGRMRGDWRLKIDDAALQPNGNGVCPIVGAKFRKNVLDVTLYGLFGDGELGCDLFVSVPA